ncbi:MAG: hypothetical protein DDT40_00999 [candidate division WS2 bacterium]|nr:hypothetical protein [Candidatus Psychracetigena formicireducens]
MAILSITGSLARLRKTVVLSIAPEASKSLIRKFASSKVMPMPAKITANDSPDLSTFACRTIWAAMRIWGIPDPENIGSFCPLTRTFKPSMEEMPVSINSLG